MSHDMIIMSVMCDHQTDDIIRMSLDDVDHPRLIREGARELTVKTQVITPHNPIRPDPAVKSDKIRLKNRR